MRKFLETFYSNVLPAREDFKGKKDLNSNMLIALVLANITALVILLCVGKFYGIIT